MISKYYIKKEKNKEILVIYLDYNYEFSNFNNKPLHNIIDYIKTKKIKFNGNKVILMMGSLILGTLILNPITKKEVINDKPIYTYVSKITLNDYNDKLELISTKEINTKDKNIKKTNTTKKQSTTSAQIKKATTKKKTSSSKNKSTTQSKSSTTTKKNTTNTTTKSNTNKTSSSLTVTVYRSNGKIIKLDLEEYIIGVVGAEMPASFNLEALKAQALVSRTYALKAIKSGKKLTDNESTQAYKSNEELKAMWTTSYNTYYNKIKKAVTSTKGMYITYNNEYIDAVFHSTSNAYTEEASNVWKNSFPYLKSVESPWDKTASTYKKTIKLTYDETSKILKTKITKDTPIEILSRTTSNRIKSIKIGNKIYTGIELRTLLKLRSTDFNINLKDNIEITTKGYGHGVGMSQYGANGMAKEGYTYKQIIKHYYQGVSINKLK